MNHAIWPEGQPEQSFETRSAFKALAHLFRMQLVQLTRLSNARRMRHATSEGKISPSYLEHSMREAGAIAPPGGWPIEKENNIPHSHSDVSVRTHSII